MRFWFDIALCIVAVVVIVAVLVFLLVLALLFLGEEFTWTKFGGVLLIIGGTLMVSLKPEQWSAISNWWSRLFA